MRTAEDRELVTSMVQAFSMPLLLSFPVQQRLHCRGSVGGFRGIEKRISIIIRMGKGGAVAGCTAFVDRFQKRVPKVLR